MWLGQKTIDVNGISTTIDTAPQIINDRTYVPIRFLLENMGLEVKWDPAKIVTISA